MLCYVWKKLKMLITKKKSAQIKYRLQAKTVQNCCILMWEDNRIIMDYGLIWGKKRLNDGQTCSFWLYKMLADGPK